MAESNATQVILTDDGLKIIKAQSTADEAVGNVNDINSDNKLTPSEKLKLKQEYDKDVELYNIDIKQLKSLDLPTAELETAMSNLTDFVTPLFKEMNRTSTVDRDALDSVFTAFATADKNSSQAFVNMVQQVADDAKKAGDDAKAAGAQAQVTGEAAKQAASQAQADATQAKSGAATAQQKAQSSIDQLNVHLPDIDKALSTANLVKQDVTKLSDTTEQYHNEYTTGIQNVIKTIDDITVGGTNLIKNSSSDVVVDDTVSKQGWKHLSVYSNLEVGQQYTFSSEVTVNVGEADKICVNTFNPNNGSTMLASDRPIVNGRIEYTFTAVKDFPVLLVYAGTMGGTKGNKVTFHHYQLEKGNKATDWSPAPEDLATSTEIDQLNNAIKLKADSSDVTSQINVATQGIQTDVTNKVSNLTTQINQTSDAIQLLAGTVGSRNLVYNATYEQLTGGFPAGWQKDSNGKAYFSTNQVSSYQGRGSIGVLTDANSLGWIDVARSQPMKLAVDNNSDANFNVYSASAMIKCYNDAGKGNGRVLVNLAAYDNNNTRLEPYMQVWSKRAKETNSTWELVKVEGFQPPKGATRIAISFWVYGDQTHAMINQPMINIGKKAEPFKPDSANQATITESINNINLKVANADGSSSQVNINNDTILLDANKIIFSGNTSILDGTIGTAKIANAAINTAQIADGAINNAKIANASIDNAKISSVSGDKIIARSITANQINVDDLIANGINTKTLTSITLNTSTLTTPKLDLGMNGTFTEDFDYTQPTGIFLPKKNKGTLTFNHGVLQSEGTMQTYVNGQWGGMNDNLKFQSGIGNDQWTEVAPGYIKMDLRKQNGADVAERIYADPTGFYYTTTGNQAYTSYVGNIVSTPQVQTASVVANTIDTFDSTKRLEIDHSGSKIGLQVGSYAGNEAVLSDYIYDFAFSGSGNVAITNNGHLARTTSASKYKYNISNPDYEDVLGDRLLNVHLASWNDKNAINSYAHTLNTGEDTEKISIDKYHGLIAEQLRDAGLDMFISYGKNHEIEGVQYDRAWIPLLSVIRRLNNKVNEYELRLSKLEGANK